MNNSQNQPILTILVSLVCLLVGLIIGYVVIGRYIWPVQWYEAEPVHMVTESQEDYLRIAIDSYTLNPDLEFAQYRYSLLGEYAGFHFVCYPGQPWGNRPSSNNSFQCSSHGSDPRDHKSNRTELRPAEVAAARR